MQPSAAISSTPSCSYTPSNNPEDHFSSGFIISLIGIFLPAGMLLCIIVCSFKRCEDYAAKVSDSSPDTFPVRPAYGFVPPPRKMM